LKIVFAGDSITASGNWEKVIDFADVENFAVPGGSTDGLLAAHTRTDHRPICDRYFEPMSHQYFRDDLIKDRI